MPYWLQQEAIGKCCNIVVLINRIIKIAEDEVDL